MTKIFRKIGKYLHYLLSIRSFNGYRSAASITGLNEAALVEIENYSLCLPNILRSAIGSKHKKSEYIIEHLLELFFGIYFQNEVGFKLPPGHKALLISIAHSVDEKMKSDSTYFKLDGNYVNCETIRTPIGTLYYAYDNIQQEQSIQITQILRKNTDATTTSIELLIEHLQESLIRRLKIYVMGMKTTEETSFLNNCKVKWSDDLGSEMVEVDHSTVMSVLNTIGITTPKIIHPNGKVVTSIAGTVHCFCSNSSKVRVFFSFKGLTKDVIVEYFSLDQSARKKPFDAALLEQFEPCWNLGNYRRHHKRVHCKRQAQVDVPQESSNEEGIQQKHKIYVSHTNILK